MTKKLRKLSANAFYSTVSSVRLVATCENCTPELWEEFYSGTTKADSALCKKIFKQFSEEDYMWLFDKNPHLGHSRRKDDMIIIVHSAIEYFFKVTHK